ncbi:MAG: transposase [Candidatus Omnitrophota bacterium]
MARIVVPDMPHHIVQRGNRRQDVFFKDEDRHAYLRLLSEKIQKYGVKLWAYCLMSNHIHLIAVPTKKESLAKAIGETHKKYTRMINFREGWRGYLWEGRFKSFLLDEKYVYAAIRYVERNPVRIKIVKRAEDYPWSSAIAHVKRVNGAVLSDFYLLDEIIDWSDYLRAEDKEEVLRIFRRHGSVGKPIGDPKFIKRARFNQFN